MEKKNQMTSSYYKFDFDKHKNVDLSKQFVIEQEELALLAGDSTNNKFKKASVDYTCRFVPQKKWSAQKPTIIIPIRNDPALLDYTLDNLSKNEVLAKVNTIVVDDRSEDEMEAPCKKHGVSYLRVDNDKGFNFSMLNNLAALVCSIKGTKEIILWNSDLWCADKNSFNEMLSRHRDYGSTISGSKLVYPPANMSFNKEKDTKNISKSFPHKKGTWRDTVQFGGSFWVPASPGVWTPIHAQRFKQADHPLVNCDKGETFVTGALLVIDTEWYLSSGGLNPSLSKVYQDVDLCLQALKDKRKIMYFGKDIQYYHDESLNHYSDPKVQKLDNQFKSDFILFGKVWKEQMFDLIQ